MSEEYINSLYELKQKLKNGKMSVMVGAGFSKNANQKFPLWGELFYDIVKEIYGDEIELRAKILN